MIRSVQDVLDVFPDLKWRDGKPTVGRSQYAIVGGDRATGDMTVFLAMEGGARAPLHTHREREDWPFRETITCLAGEMYETDPNRPDFVLRAGMTVDLPTDKPHSPYVSVEGFALVTYRQPAGSDAVPE